MINKNQWEDVIPDDDTWKHETVGAKINGIYKAITPNSGQHHKNKYTFEVEEDGEIKETYFYGTTHLDKLFKKVEIGHEVCIELVKLIPQRGARKDFQVFKMQSRPPYTIQDLFKDIQKAADEKLTAEQLVKHCLDNQEALELTQDDILDIKKEAATMHKEEETK